MLCFGKIVVGLRTCIHTRAFGILMLLNTYMTLTPIQQVICLSGVEAASLGFYTEHRAPLNRSHA